MTPFNRLFKHMTKPWVVVSYTLLMVFLFMYVDAPVAMFFHRIELGYIQPLSERITLLGKSKPLIGALIGLIIGMRYVLHWHQWEMRAWFLAACTFVPSLIVLGLKIIFGRARPELLFDDGLYGFQWFQFSRAFWSFPSGHTATLMGCMLGACIAWPRYRFLFLGIGFLVMTTRVILLQHYISDVLVSAYLVLLEVWVIQWLFDKYAPNFMKEVRG